MCVWIFHMVNINVPAGVGIPQLDMNSETALTYQMAMDSYMGVSCCSCQWYVTQGLILIVLLLSYNSNGTGKPAQALGEMSLTSAAGEVLC